MYEKVYRFIILLFVLICLCGFIGCATTIGPTDSDIAERNRQFITEIQSVSDSIGGTNQRITDDLQRAAETNSKLGSELDKLIGLFNAYKEATGRLLAENHSLQERLSKAVKDYQDSFDNINSVDSVESGSGYDRLR